MIFDKICNIKNYKGINKNLDIAIDSIARKEYIEGISGKNLVLEEEVFFNVQNYITKNQEECFFETHKEYLDIQLVMFGEEKIGVTEIEKLKLDKEYDKERDLETQKGDPEIVFEMNKNNFLILFPGEPHMPGIKNNENIEIKKIVYKIKMD